MLFLYSVKKTNKSSITFLILKNQQTELEHELMQHEVNVISKNLGVDADSNPMTLQLAEL